MLFWNSISMRGKYCEGVKLGHNKTRPNVTTRSHLIGFLHWNILLKNMFTSGAEREFLVGGYFGLFYTRYEEVWRVSLFFWFGIFSYAGSGDHKQGVVSALEFIPKILMKGWMTIGNITFHVIISSMMAVSVKGNIFLVENSFNW